MVRAIALVAITACWAATAQAADVEGAADHPLVGRFEGAEIVSYSHSDFDEYRLIVEPLTTSGSLTEENAGHTQRLEGELTRITYKAPEGASSLAVFRAYQDALAANGFEVLFECSGEDACGHGNGYNFNRRSPGRTAPGSLSVTQRFINTEAGQTRFQALKKPDPEGDVYVSLQVVEERAVYAQVDVVKVEAQESKVVVIEAGEMAEKIGESGKVALYGLYFDTDEATIKPDSKPTLDEIGALLENNPDLKLLVVGHSDNQGDFDYNVDLSKRRAAAVAQALAGDYGVDAARLKPWGVGYAAPVATNNSEAGRASNRRVELVEQ